MKKRVFSGIQPTGNIHLGNYLAAIRNWVASQPEYDNIFCVVNLHAITVHQDPGVLRAKTRELAALLFACGIDPEQSTLFVQSHVPAHSELAWILNCFIPMGWMQRMTQFKEKSGEHQERVSVGLFDYPALMAADILLYDTDRVPVGEDQKQHVELARDVAQRFNTLYGDTFKVPVPFIPDVGARIMGLDDPSKKMSKSDSASGHGINLLDPPDQIVKKIKRATTDSQREIVFDPARPGIYNLLTIFELCSGLKRPVIEAQFEGKGYGDFKSALAEVVVTALEPVQRRYHELIDDPAQLDAMLRGGAEKLKPIAADVLRRVQDKVGLG
jgi:tryptophanyl-tRNA synthetase